MAVRHSSEVSVNGGTRFKIVFDFNYLKFEQPHMAPRLDSLNLANDDSNRNVFK